MGCTNCRHKIPQEHTESDKLSITTNNKFEQINIIPNRQLRKLQIYIDIDDQQKIEINNFKELYNPFKREFYFSKQQQQLLQKNFNIKSSNKFHKIEKINLEQQQFIQYGGTSSIYKSYCNKIEKYVVIKKIFLNNFSQEQQNQFYKEQKFLEINSHPNIIKYYGSNTNEQFIEIIMEYASQGSLKDLLNKEKYFSEQQVINYTKEILKGLQYIHSKNFIYRDLKLENLVIDNKGNLKIIDFGAIIDINHKSEIDIGTINYQAPELFNQSKQNIERYIDIWSLGCLVYEMLTGKSLFPNQQNIQTIQEILSYQNLSQNYEILSCSIKTKDFIQCCLEINPKKRNNCYELLQHPFLSTEQYNQTLTDLEQIKINSNQVFSCENLDEKEIYLKKNTFFKNNSNKKNFSKTEKQILITKIRKSFQHIDENIGQTNKKKRLNKEMLIETIESVDLIIQNQ